MFQFMVFILKSYFVFNSFIAKIQYKFVIHIEYIGIAACSI